TWTPEQGGGGPSLWEHDAFALDSGWMPENVDFLTAELTLDFVNRSVAAAVERLRDEPEWELARRIEADLFGNQEWFAVQGLIAARTTELPRLLASTKISRTWSI